MESLAAVDNLSAAKACPGDEIGSRRGLKIRGPSGACGFESHPGHPIAWTFPAYLPSIP